MTLPLYETVKKRTMTDKQLADRLSLFQNPDTRTKSGAKQKTEFRNLLHELEVSQIELEVQNRELMESRASLEESHEKYLNLYDCAPVGYVTLDKLGTILELNLTAAEVLNAERRRMIGRLFSTVVIKSDQQKFRDHLLRCRSGEKVISDTIHLINIDRKLRPVQLTSVSFRDRVSGACTFRTAMADLTKQKQAETERLQLLGQVEASRNQLHGFFMQASTPMVILEGPEHRYVLANPPYEQLVGKKVLNKTVREVFLNGELASLIPFLDAVFRTGIPYIGKELPIDLPNKDGDVARLWIDVGYHPFRAETGEITGVMAVHHDVTGSVCARQQLELAKQEAEKTTISKSAFLANMSHEIRTPLGAILGFTQIIKSSDCSAERERYGTIVSRNGKALTRIIDDILDLSKVESGKLELELIDFDLKSMMTEVVSLFQEATENKNIELRLTIHPDMPSMVKSDPTRIRQILINLIGNAVKFTAEGFISIYAEPRYSCDGVTGVGFTVEDSGIGMTNEQIDRIFAPFSQADNSMTRKFGGSGLGLVLSRRLARALGGDVTVVSSDPEIGSVFFASVDVGRAERALAGADIEEPSVVGRAVGQVTRVLLVEDSPDNQLLVKIFLAKAGISVDIANNGAEGVEMAEVNEYDVVLMDMQMPVLDGYAATKQLRSDGYSRPIVALTAHAMLEDRSRILEVGCNAHLTKPIDACLLIETLNRIQTNRH